MRRLFYDGASAVRRRQDLVQGGEEQLSILRREYQRQIFLASTFLVHHAKLFEAAAVNKGFDPKPT